VIQVIAGTRIRWSSLTVRASVAGHRILDAGCGSGPLFAALRDRWARPLHAMTEAFTAAGFRIILQAD
jgi:2-polyprenyl-3-methyl-5-hydroxy-6-metoxy-1,4-benzoquinol methylase